MKVLIFGGKGMAGHVIASYLKENPNYDVYYTSRDVNDKQSIFFEATDLKRLEDIIKLIKPDISINCIGILNDSASNNPLLAFRVNSLLPYQLAKLMGRYQGKLI